MMQKVFCAMAILGFLTSTAVEARVGGGRTFGNRGSRGFSAPFQGGGSRNTFSRPSYSSPESAGTQRSSNSTFPPRTESPSRFSPWRTLGAGLAGGFLGSLLFRTLGFAGPSLHGFGGGGVGFLEIFLIAGLIFILFRLFSRRTQTNPSAGPYYPRVETEPQSSTGAEDLFRKARAQNTSSSTDSTSSLSNEEILDLFFRIQGAWANRDLLPVQSILDREARDYLETELSRLKSDRHINRLENIAIRNSEIVESWKDSGKSFATARIVASVLDYTIHETTQEVISGSKSTPVKFEEYWTFSKEDFSPQWKLSAIQQT